LIQKKFNLSFYERNLIQIFKNMKNKNIYIKPAQALKISAGLSLLISGTLILPSCSSSTSSEEADYEVSEDFTKGVKTYIKETEKGKFMITDEIEVPKDSSMSIITYLDGRVEKLDAVASKAKVEEEMRQNPNFHNSGFGIGNAILYGGMGYLLARTLAPNFGSYRPDYRKEEERSGGSRAATYASGSRKYYTNETAYQKANTVNEGISKSRTFVSKPVNSRSGFGRSSRGGGFGG
jgi:hypothetical protein